MASRTPLAFGMATLSIVVCPACEEDLDLNRRTERALDAGIAAAVIGNSIGVISHAIGSVASETGLRVNTEFGGRRQRRGAHAMIRRQRAMGSTAQRVAAVASGGAARVPQASSRVPLASHQTSV